MGRHKIIKSINTFIVIGVDPAPVNTGICCLIDGVPVAWDGIKGVLGLTGMPETEKSPLLIEATDRIVDAIKRRVNEFKRPNVIVAVEIPLRSVVRNVRVWKIQVELYGMIMYALSRTKYNIAYITPAQARKTVNISTRMAKIKATPLIQAFMAVHCPEDSINEYNKLNLRCKADCADAYAVAVSAERQYKRDAYLKGGTYEQ